MAESSKSETNKTEAGKQSAGSSKASAGNDDGKPQSLEGLPVVADDVAAYDARARGDELEMSDRDAGSSHLAASNQVPQEGALVTDPPQPVPPKDSNIKHQDHSDEYSRTVEYPKDRPYGHAVPNEYPRDAQK
jgi:hypothetical protein